MFLVLLQSARLPFLILTPACVFLGVASVLAEGQAVAVPDLLLVLFGAVMAHASVNLLNEYMDFRSGLDLHTERTPFSGGSGALPAQPVHAMAVRNAGLIALLATTLVGVAITAQHGAAIVPLGLLGLLLVAGYTPWINRFPWVCLVAPGLGFGLLMVAGTHFALTGSYSSTAWLVALVPFFQVNGLLLLNQFPDADADARAGRKHIVIHQGAARAAQAYGVLALAPAVVIVLAIAQNRLPASCALALLTQPLAWRAWVGARRYGTGIGAHKGYLAGNVIVAVATPVLLGVGLILRG